MPSVVVLGAGPAGAAAALFLARRGLAVTVLDQDPVFTQDSGSWSRDGVPHARQGHSYLALATRVLDEGAPDVVQAVLAAGARRVALCHVPGHANLLMRRRVFETALWSALGAQRGVRVLSRTKATGLLFEPASAGVPPHVFGITTEDGDITADLVVDAGGRRSPVPGWLEAHGVEVEVVFDRTPFFYLTRHYRLREDAVFPSTDVPIVSALDYATVLAFPEDNGHFQLTVQLDVADPCRRALRDGALFDRFLAEVPLSAPWLAAGTPVGEPEPVGSVGNCRKRLFGPGPRVTGLVLVGDAAVHTNPTAGRGSALALAHAALLARLAPEALAEGWDRPTVSRRFHEASSRLLDPWFSSQLELDRQRRLQIRASVQGQRWDAASDLSGNLAAALVALQDSELVSAAGTRLFNLLSTPAEIYADREVMRRVVRQMRVGPQAPAKVGPSRQQYERLITAETRP